MKQLLFAVLVLSFVSCTQKSNSSQQNDKDEIKITENKLDTKMSLPDEFNDGKWRNGFGNFRLETNFDTNTIQSCTWHYLDGILFFSKTGKYIYGGYFSGPLSYGDYSITNYEVNFKPPLLLYRYDEEYNIEKMMFSKEKHFQGYPVLKNADDSVVFAPFEAKKPENGESVLLNGYHTIIEWKEGSVNVNSILYRLPNSNSKSVFFDDNYYGKKATEAKLIIRASTLVNEKKWYYCLLDFSSGDPEDGGGPYYQGWLPVEYVNEKQ